MSVSLMLSIVAVTFAGAFTQATAGFGAPIIMLAFFPHWFPYSTSVTICHLIALASTLYLVIRYRKSVAWKTLLPVLALSLTIGTIATLFSLQVQSAVMTRALGFFLVAVALFFFLMPPDKKIKATVRNGIIAGSTAGICNGLFGISAPPTALYFMGALSEKEAYMGTMQAFFLFSNLQSIIVRTAKGSLSGVPFLPILLGWISILLGTFLGQKLYRRLPLPVIKKIIYIFVALSGVWNIISST